MIRVCIAEDEPPTLRRIKRMIEQADPEFTVAITAADGEEALAAMEASPCDVLFTDIRMPVIDGLQLMDTVRARYPDCQIVIISGYQDFSYVAHAVRASAADYLLKPVSQEDMDALVARLKETHTRRKKERMTKKLSATINRTEAGVLEESAAEHAGTGFCVCLFCAGPVPLGDAENPLLDSADLDRLSPEDALHGILPAYGGFTWSFVGNTQVERILIFERTDGPIGDVASRLHTRLQGETDVPISCACAVYSVALPEIGRTIARLRRLLLSSSVIGRGIYAEMTPDDVDGKPPRLYNDHPTARALAELLQSGRFAADGAFFGGLSAQMARESWTGERIHALFAGAFAYLEAEKGATAELMQARSLVADVLSSALSFDDFTAGLAGLTSLFSVAEETDEALQHTVAARVEQYLAEHYAEHINNQTLGMEFGYVPSYISLLFRRAYGTSPAEYLIKLRLDTAKRMMRERPKMLIRDIAEQVGFKSPHHFSRIFKKYEGVWPTEFPPDGG